MGKKRRRMPATPDGEKKKPKKPKLREIVFDPEVLSKVSSDSEGAEFFFELANADVVRFRSSGGEVVIEQDRDIEGEGQEEGVPQTGGIVWETAYLVFMYLKSLHATGPPPRSVLEVGAGCGLLGLALAQEWGARVTLTDTPTATKTLLANVSRNADGITAPAFVEAKVLRWDALSEDQAELKELKSQPPDIIVGTDVVFTERLVVPLLESVHAFARAETVVFLCLQTRCAAAHAMLLREAPRFFKFHDISSELHALPGCGRVAKEMECHLLRLDTPKKTIAVIAPAGGRS